MGWELHIAQQLRTHHNPHSDHLWALPESAQVTPARNQLTVNE